MTPINVGDQHAPTELLSFAWGRDGSLSDYRAVFECYAARGQVPAGSHVSIRDVCLFSGGTEQNREGCVGAACESQDGTPGESCCRLAGTDRYCLETASVTFNPFISAHSPSLWPYSLRCSAHRFECAPVQDLKAACNLQLQHQVRPAAPQLPRQQQLPRQLPRQQRCQNWRRR